MRALDAPSPGVARGALSIPRHQLRLPPRDGGQRV